MRRAELAATVLAAAALAGCGSGGSATPGSTSTTSSRSTSPTTSPATGTETTPIETSTTGHRPACPYCGAGLDPESAAKAVLTATDPAIGCGVLVTPRYVEAAYGGARGCAAAVTGGGSAKSLRILTTRRSEAGALVIAIPSGGPNDGERLEISMLHEPADLPRGRRTPPLWRVDAVRSNAKVGP